MTDANKVPQERKLTWQKPLLLCALIVMIALQFTAHIGGDAVIGFPFNFYSYNAKFDAHHFFAMRLVSSLLFLGILLAGIYALMHFWTCGRKSNGRG
ncbi:hypothetical protein QWZ04_18240 [Vibrio tapetis subsp. quintayensis]|uniref:hypothetical protein n=1 Tax=Vibrio tapetis TaxID=52443 RepID=UPI0025B4DCC4|nr:hypothetical protein [Vibrio tapetis]MDN3682245.1 hypothetical protein [Vibrio tapetis subsp. quintayensis]